MTSTDRSATSSPLAGSERVHGAFDHDPVRYARYAAMKFGDLVSCDPEIKGNGQVQMSRNKLEQCSGV